MPQVPYAPVPDVSPANIPSPPIRVSPPPAAFGVNIGQAIEHLGATENQVGGELATRAFAMQQLRNETESTSAIGNLERKSRDLQINYTTKRGLDAVNGLAEHQQSQDDLRQSIRNSLSNPAAQRMYDRSSLFIMNRELGVAASHAATENRIAADGTAKARLQQIYDSIAENPQDERNFQEGLRQTDELLQTQAGVNGWGKDEADRKAFEAASAARAHRIAGWNRHDPDGARKLFEANKEFMTYKDIESLEPRIQAQEDLISSRNIAHATHLGWAPYMGEGAIRKAESIQEPLQRIVQQAQRDNPGLRFTVASGKRDIPEQTQLFAEGKTTTIYGSNHLTGRAIDLQPLGSTSSAQVEAAMKAASDKLGIPLGPEHDRIKSWDPNHYSLPREYDVSTAPKKVDEPLQAALDRQRRYVEDAYPDNPRLPDIAAQRLETEYRLAKQIQENTIRDSNNSLDSRMMNRGDNSPSTSMEELLNDPQARQAYEALPPEEQRKWPGKINTYNRQVNQSDQVFLSRMTGVRADSPDEFQNYDFLGDKSLPLSQPDRRRLKGEQEQDKKSGQGDPVVRRALRLPDVKLKLDDSTLNINKRGDQEQKDNYHDFVGALAEAIHYETERNKKPPSDDEIRGMVKKLLYGRQVTGFFQDIKQFFGGSPSEAPLFNIGQTLPSAEREALRKELLEENPGQIITDQDIDIRAALNAYKAFGKK